MRAKNNNPVQELALAHSFPAIAVSIHPLPPLASQTGLVTRAPDGARGNQDKSTNLRNEIELTTVATKQSSVDHKLHLQVHERRVL